MKLGRWYIEWAPFPKAPERYMWYFSIDMSWVPDLDPEYGIFKFWYDGPHYRLQIGKLIVCSWMTKWGDWEFSE